MTTISQSNSEPITTAIHLMNHGTALHAQRQLEPALVQFEQALRQEPSNVNALNACVAVLLELNRPHTAYELMLPRIALISDDADSLCNWAIVCESINERHRADEAYEQVLQLQPQHLRALNNSALNALAQHEWPKAIARLELCCKLAPDEPALRLNLIDCFCAAHESSAALKHAALAMERWPDHPDLELRYAIQLAFNGQLAAATLAIKALSSAATTRLQEYLSTMSEAAARMGRASVQMLPPAEELYFIHQFSALNHCDWRDHARLCATLKQAIASSYTEATGRDWRDVQFYALMLPLEEEQQSQCMRHTFRHITERFPLKPKTTSPHPPSPDGKIHIGVALQNLYDARHRHAMETWFTHADRDRFVYHFYSNTPAPQAVLTEQLQSLGASVVEINHLSVGDTIKRMRLDRLDVYLDTAFYTPWCRAEIPYGNVAPINIRLQSWQRWNSGAYQYVIGDRITHPDSLDRNYLGPTVRLPHTCWLALNQDQPLVGIDRKALGLPESALVFAAFNAPLAIDPESFATWMSILKTLPDAIICFPNFDPGTRANLTREAKLQGIGASRIAFCSSVAPMPGGGATNARDLSTYLRAWALAQLQCADFFLDSLRFGSSYTLSDALRLGIPSATVIGNNLASRLGASILSAAQLNEAILTSTSEYVTWIQAWARGDNSLTGIKAQLQRIKTHPPISPLFDTASRVKSWESAIQQMVERSRSNLPLQAFDL